MSRLSAGVLFNSFPFLYFFLPAVVVGYFAVPHHRLRLLGIVGTYTIGAFVHVLLVVAIVLFVVGLLSGRRSMA